MKQSTEHSGQIQAIYRQIINTQKTPRSELARLKKQLQDVPLTSETLPAWKKYFCLAQKERAAFPARFKIFHDVLIQRIKEIDPANQKFIDEFRQTFGVKLSNSLYWTAKPEAKPKPPKKAEAT